MSSTPSPADRRPDRSTRAGAGDLAWLESFPQWPAGGLGLGRMHALLDLLGHPERRFEAVHVVGTKGKSTAARTIAALLRAEGRRSAAYTSPHVAGWHERLETDPAAFRAALARVRPAAEEAGASQFETLTAAAFADFAARGVETAVVEAGVGGRLDATNVLDAAVVLLTNVGLEHTELLGGTRAAIAAEKLAVAGPDATVVLPDAEFAPLVAGRRVVVGGAREAAAASLGRPVRAEVDVSLPGRLELRPNGDVLDGAHTPDAVDGLLGRLPRRGDYAVVASVLDTKDVDGILDRLAAAGDVLVATASSHERSLPAGGLADRARGRFAVVEAVAEPRAAVARARRYGRPLLVTGSLYLLADLMSERTAGNTYDVAAR